MMSLLKAGLALGAVALCVTAAAAQPPQGEIRTRQRQGGRPDDGDGPRHPPHWRLGTLIPQPIQEELGLSEDQEQKLRDIERDVRDRVLKMLTGEQRKKLQSMEKRVAGGPSGPPSRGRHGDRPPRRGEGTDDDRPPPPDERPGRLGGRDRPGNDIPPPPPRDGQD